ncbi:DNA topoisomerase 2-binding protein 1 isoform X1 [Helianthus annuus]|uniref:DNA topoisomerase 2-binding protein 1 isoform X1 n=2 Tax=Helianthus annuus TaxID=4232 RepID=UPI000B8F2268|nr:DNA topoisomerase 2-binding protein 1 isoform X1 [Helianthus annuus]
MRKTTFKGANVFMSRNLVAPEIFDSLHDVLKDNGADIVLCCDPSRNGPNDFHIISSRDHEKFNDLRQKGCNLLGPQCVFSCAKENRVLPKQGFTCCLAMDGVKILASGFEMKEKDEIGKLVTAMGGVLQTKASSDVSFVIVKNVLAAKYKWALNNLKKPIVSDSWLHRCWKEHRVVSHEPYRTLPFSGLTISVTQVPLDERKEIEKLVQQNGGKYSAELTRKSTHLVCDAPEGDKYKVAKRWGHIHIVSRTWFNQSVARRACLNEESYPVQKTSVTSTNSQRTSSKVVKNAEGSSYQEISCDGMVDADLEATLSQNMASTISDIPVPVSDDNTSTPPCVQHKTSFNIDACVAEDSQSEDNDLYLLNCKIHLVGFDASEMRRLVNMVRRGGGSRYMSLNEQLTHIVVGSPSESEKKEVRSLSAMGVINVVKTVWLEDCEREKKEISVLRRHAAYDLLLPKDSISYNKGSVNGIPGLKQGNPSTIQPAFSNDLSKSLSEGRQRTQHVISNKSQEKKSSVFIGRSFRFSSSFPDVQRGEIVDWIHEGGGEVVDSQTKKIVDYTVEAHGVLCRPTQLTGATNVSPHWIRSCLQDGHLLDVRSHLLFSPLQCKVPLPGFIGLQFCVSQYEEKDRELLRNLCHVLGGKLIKKLTKKVNYLICKFSEGPKYEAACQWGMQTVTIEWIWECVKQNKVVSSSQFLPKEATASDRESGMCTMSQYPTQAVRMISAPGESQLASQPREPVSKNARIADGISTRKEDKYAALCSKKPRLYEDGVTKGLLSSVSVPITSVCTNIATENAVTENGAEVSKSVPDVASAIEDLLEQTSKIHDQMSPDRTATDKNVSEQVFTSDCSRLGHDLHSEDPHSAFGLSKHWTGRSNEKDDISNPGKEENAGIYGNFSETQTESQVVSYEEDLSGRQMIIDRVRTRSGLTPNPN